MCQVNDGDDALLPKPAIQIGIKKTCVKCDALALHVIGTNGTFCSECFEKYFTHKFRASMGRNPIVRNGDKVLVAYSGGNNSAALLHLIKQGLDPKAQRKLKFIPGIIFINESILYPDENFDEKIEKIQEIMKESSFPNHTVKLEEVFNISKQSSLPVSSERGSSCADKLVNLIKSASTLSAKQELVYRLRCQLLSFKASQLGYAHVFLAETSTRLAINILSNVALGRGVHLAHDTGFSDGGRFEGIGVNLLRPIRDISAKEVVMYNALHKVDTVFLPNLSTKQGCMSSIPNLTEGFVLGLVAGFPSTEMTVYRTSNKIKGVQNVSEAKQGGDELTNDCVVKCRLCFGFIDNNTDTAGASAREDVTFSKLLCNGSPHKDIENETSVSPDLQTTHNALCYSCSTLKNETSFPDGKDFTSLLPDKNDETINKFSDLLILE